MTPAALNQNLQERRKLLVLSKYITPSFFIGAVAAAVIAAAQALSVYDGNFETATYASIATVAGTAVVRALGIYLSSKFGAGE